MLKFAYDSDSIGRDQTEPNWEHHKTVIALSTYRANSHSKAYAGGWLMRWGLNAWRTAAGRAGTQCPADTPEPYELDLLALTPEQLLSRYQRASRLTC